MPDATLIIDTECYRGFWYLGVKRREDGRRVGFEFSERADFDRERVRYFLRRNLSVGFNSIGYDLPMIYLALSGATNDELKDASDHIIKDNVPWWEVQKALGVHVPDIDHIDLFETNPAVRDSLKTLNGRMHGQRMQDLPFDPATILTHDEMDVVADYCLHSDLDATDSLFEYLKEPIALRVAMGERYGEDFRSKSDAQMGERIIRSQVEEKTGRRVKKVDVKVGDTFRYEPPDWMRFETPQLQEVFKTICATDLTINKDGKVVPPKKFKELNTTFGASTYSIGIGGIHSTEKSRSLVADEDYVLIDADVASQYPKIIMSRGLYPAALGPEFLPVYQTLLDQRLAAKESGDKVTDKGLKISINGAYGKLGSKYSVLYAPHLLTTVTITGQLSILMLIERAELAGIQVVSGNTDGVVFRCPRSMFNGFIMKDGKLTDALAPSPLADITDWWMKLTGFKLEFAEYSAIYNRDVNYYVAIKPDGKAKRKNAIANHWHPDSPDYDPTREQLKKNPQMTVLGDACLAYILHGTPIDEFIRDYDDMRGFVTIINAAGGATWRDEYLGKVVRYYWSTDGDPIIKVKAHASTGNRPKVPKTDGCRPAMNLPESVPPDIDFARYVAEAEQMLRDIGFYNRQTADGPLITLCRALLFN